MKKNTAITLLGGTVAEAAKTLGVTYQSVKKWPDVLPLRIADRVIGAALRKFPARANELIRIAVHLNEIHAKG